MKNSRWFSCNETQNWSELKYMVYSRNLGLYCVYNQLLTKNLPHDGLRSPMEASPKEPDQAHLEGLERTHSVVRTQKVSNLSLPWPAVSSVHSHSLHTEPVVPGP